MFPKTVLKAAITTHGDADVRSDRNAGNDVRVRDRIGDDRVHLTPPRRLCWSPAFLDCGGAVRYLKRPQLADESFVASHPPRGQPTSVSLSEGTEKRQGWLRSRQDWQPEPRPPRDARFLKRIRATLLRTLTDENSYRPVRMFSEEKRGFARSVAGNPAFNRQSIVASFCNRCSCGVLLQSRSNQNAAKATFGLARSTVAAVRVCRQPNRGRYTLRPLRPGLQVSRAGGNTGRRPHLRLRRGREESRR